MERSARASSATFGRLIASKVLCNAASAAHQRQHGRYPRPCVMKSDDDASQWQIQKPVLARDEHLRLLNIRYGTSGRLRGRSSARSLRDSCWP